MSAKKYCSEFPHYNATNFLTSCKYLLYHLLNSKFNFIKFDNKPNPHFNPRKDEGTNDNVTHATSLQ